ncbi:hypothetical protein AC630_08175 [Bradyrhizobium sp. AS23.2]|nr:hypothetical protein AC630_08175 [Bradyrhizobium sp. AS23.2]
MRLVLGIDLVAEGDLRLVEHDGEMRRPVVGGHVAQKLPQHVAEAEHGVDLKTVRLAVQRRQRVIGTEDVAGTVNQEDVVALAGGLRRDRSGSRFGSSGLGVGGRGRSSLGVSFGGGLRGGFGHGRNV